MRARVIALREGSDHDGFRHAVRALLAENVQPDDVVFSSRESADLFGSGCGAAGPAVELPRRLIELMRLVVCHRDPERYALLYRAIWRMRHGERALLDVASDPLVHRLAMMDKAIRRDLHKMHAFVRFRRVETPDGERFVAWFEPDHYIVETTAGFFVDRFRSLVWSILTPVGSLHWDRHALTIGPPGRREDAPASDAFEEGWSGYYESTFNPARVNPRMMRTEMPKKYWRNLPEAAAIPRLIQTAPSRVTEMIEKEAAMPTKRDPVRAVAAMAGQEPKSLAELNRIIASSEPLVPGATQAVLGEGPIGATLAFVGEQPGDQEDLQGRPFVGPAGQLLDRAFAAAGIDRSRAYLTNAVKHFKFEQRGKRRIHKKPTTGEVKRYRWWLRKELSFVRPQIVVALGATAALALSGKAIAVGKERGPTSFDGQSGYVTVHPSYLLRLPDAEAKEQEFSAFVADLKRARSLVEQQRAAG